MAPATASRARALTIFPQCRKSADSAKCGRLLAGAGGSLLPGPGGSLRGFSFARAGMVDDGFMPILSDATFLSLLRTSLSAARSDVPRKTPLRIGMVRCRLLCCTRRFHEAMLFCGL